jgi:hypothetical protein
MQGLYRRIAPKTDVPSIIGRRATLVLLCNRDTRRRTLRTLNFCGESNIAPETLRECEHLVAQSAPPQSADIRPVDLIAIPPGNKPIAVVLGFVDPCRPAGSLLGGCREAGVSQEQGEFSHQEHAWRSIKATRRVGKDERGAICPDLGTSPQSADIRPVDLIAIPPGNKPIGPGAGAASPIGQTAHRGSAAAQKASAGE